MFAAILPLVLSLAPQLAGMIFGSKGGDAAAKVTQVVQSVVGVDPTTAEGAQAAIEMIKGNPQAAMELQQKLGDLHVQMQAEADRESDQQRKDTLDSLKAELADVGSARDMSVQLANAHSPLVYGSIALSSFIILGFSIMLYLVLTGTAPLGPNNSALANVLLGTLAAMATQVANFWLGSSSGSQAKSATIAQAQSLLQNSVPSQLVRVGQVNVSS